MIHIRYYVLRGDMLAFYISDLRVRLSKRDEPGGWEVSTINLIDMNGAIYVGTGGRGYAPLRNVDTGSRPVGAKSTSIASLRPRDSRSAANIRGPSRAAHNARAYW
jgi:hypothetical protein